jgi:predicted nucleic acid-binding protein
LKITFIDSGVLIAIARGQLRATRRALEILNDPERIFASSAYVCLEVLPKASFHKREVEVAFYELFFRQVERWADPGAALLETAFTLGRQHGLSGLDALHGAAALSVGASELITTERLGSPLHRLDSIKVTTIHAG